MKRRNQIVVFILLVVFSSILSAQSATLERKLRRNQTQLQKLRKIVYQIQNNEIKILYTEAENLMDQAWQRYRNGNNAIAQSLLLQSNAKLLRIWQILRNTPAFNRKFMAHLEKKLSTAERQVRSSGNQTAIYYLDQAYSFKQQGLNLTQSASGQFVNGIELLYMAENFANRAISLAASATDETESRQDFTNQYKSLSEKLQFYRKSARTQIPNKTLNELQKALQRANMAFKRGNISRGFQILRRVENRFSQLTSAAPVRMSITKLYRQFQIQKNTVSTMEELLPENPVNQKLMERILSNLESIEVHFNNEAFVQCEKLLKTNHQLIRTLKKIIDNQHTDISANINRKIQNFEEKISELQSTKPLSETDRNNLDLAKHLLAKAKKQNSLNHPLASAIYLRSVYKILDVINSSESDTTYSPALTLEEARQKLKIVDRKIEQLPESPHKSTLQEMIANIHTNINKNNMQAAKILLDITIESLEENSK